MTLHTLISKHELSAAHLARKTNMQRGTFNNKLKGNNGAAFSEDELEQITKVLENLNRDLINFIK